MWFNRLPDQPAKASGCAGPHSGGQKFREAGTKASPPNCRAGPVHGPSGKVQMRIPVMVLLACGFATAAQAQERGSVLDRAAGLVGQCIAEQTATELGKGTAPGQFAAVLRDKCRQQEQ